MSRMRWIFLGLVCLLGFSASSGCSGGVGSLTPVEGKVTVSNTPHPGGQINFWPATPPKTPMTIAGTIDASGNYKMTTNGKPGVPAGTYKVTITTMNPGTGGSDPANMTAPKASAGPTKIADDKYGGQASTPLSVTVPSPSYDIAATR